MGRYRVLALGVALIVVASGFVMAGARATPDFDCNTSITWGRSGAEITWNATESCDVPIGGIAFSSAMAGPSGAIENAGTDASCADCSSDSTQGAVWALPGSSHTLIVNESAVAPPGELWGVIDSACTGSGSTTIFCHWQLPIQELPVAIDPATTGIDAGQQLIDQTVPQPQ